MLRGSHAHHRLAVLIATRPSPLCAPGQANYPIMPDCTSLQPAPCGVSPFTNPDGSINFTAGYLVRRGPQHAPVLGLPPM